MLPTTNKPWTWMCITKIGHSCCLLAQIVFRLEGAGLLGRGACALGLAGDGWVEGMKYNFIPHVQV